MGKQYIVKGAMAQCNQSKVPMVAQIQLIPDNMFVNMNGNPAATTMTLGPVFGPAPFGICNMIPPTPAVPTPPCVCAIVSWSGADTAVKINMISNPLTTDSKGTCALGGSISFKMSGQYPKFSTPPMSVPAVPDMNAAATIKKKIEKKNFQRIQSIDDLNYDAVKYFVANFDENERREIISYWIANDIFPTKVMRAVNETCNSNDNITIDQIELVDINLRAAAGESFSEPPEKAEKFKQVQDVADIVRKESLGNSEVITKAAPINNLEYYVQVDKDGNLVFPEENDNWIVWGCVSTPYDDSNRLSTRNRINVLGLEYNGTKWKPQDPCLNIVTQANDKRREAAELNRPGEGKPNNGGYPDPPYSGGGFTQGMGIDMFVRKENASRFEDGDCINIYNDKGECTHVLEFRKKEGEKCGRFKLVSGNDESLADLVRLSHERNKK